jgi:glycerol-3-phosphate cytidylyltransferase
MKIITYGTFDLFHTGHLNLLKRCKSLGSHLTVAVSTDEFNSLKNKKSFFSFQDRFNIVNSIRYVDQVIAEESWEQKINDILNYKIDIFVIGDDWKGKFDYLNKYCKVIYLERTEGISSTIIKNKLKLY